MTREMFIFNNVDYMGYVVLGMAVLTIFSVLFMFFIWLVHIRGKWPEPIQTKALAQPSYQYGLLHISASGDIAKAVFTNGKELAVERNYTVISRPIIIERVIQFKLLELSNELCTSSPNINHILCSLPLTDENIRFANDVATAWDNYHNPIKSRDDYQPAPPSVVVS